MASHCDLPAIAESGLTLTPIPFLLVTSHLFFINVSRSTGTSPQTYTHTKYTQERRPGHAMSVLAMDLHLNWRFTLHPGRKNVTWYMVLAMSKQQFKSGSPSFPGTSAYWDEIYTVVLIKDHTTLRKHVIWYFFGCFNVHTHTPALTQALTNHYGWQENRLWFVNMLFSQIKGNIFRWTE